MTIIAEDRGFSAEIIADSINPWGNRLTTMVVRYPRFIHAEVMSHRVFSRNTVSSRAMPVKKLLEQVRHDPALPIFWGKNQPGMQANEELPENLRERSEENWLWARNEAVNFAETLLDIGLHKQLANRLLEPFMWHTAIISSTSWRHFFHLRRHPDAQPEFKLLADLMFDVRQRSTPSKLEPGQWHLPFVTKADEEWAYLNVSHETEITPCGYATENGAVAGLRTVAGPDPNDFYFQKLSVARCARVSYLNHDGTQPNPLKDFDLHDRLIKAPHASPFEHQATPEQGRHGNFVGFKQYRQMIANEYLEEEIYDGAA